MLIRPATPAEMADPPEFTVSDPVGALDADRLRDEAAGGRMRPEWTWFAADGSRIVGRAVWWGRADSERPLALDCLHVATRGARPRRPRRADPVPRAGRVRRDPAVRPGAANRLARRSGHRRRRGVARRRGQGGRADRRQRAAPVRVDTRRRRARSLGPPGLPSRRGRGVPRRIPAGRRRQPRCHHAAGGGRDGCRQAGPRRSRVLPLLPRRPVVVAAGRDGRRRAGRLRHPVGHAVPPQRRVPRRRARTARPGLRR